MTLVCTVGLDFHFSGAFINNYSFSSSLLASRERNLDFLAMYMHTGSTLNPRYYEFQLVPVGYMPKLHVECDDVSNKTAWCESGRNEALLLHEFAINVTSRAEARVPPDSALLKHSRNVAVL